MIAGLIIGSMLGGIITFTVMACVIVGAESEKTNKK